MKTVRIGFKLYIIVVSVLAAAFLFENGALPYWYKFRPMKPALADQPVLEALAGKALVTKDVPIAAILLYRGKVIGAGYNRVQADQKICSHAEINALNDASGNLGIAAFNDIDPKDLSLITTFEPCSMCRGALAEHGIFNVTFILPKKGKDKIFDEKKEWLYYLNRTAGSNPYFQYRMFKKHPDFDSVSYPF